MYVLNRKDIVKLVIKQGVLEMKKIGILTFHYSQNYGAVLQCYSLSKVLSTLGYEVEVINYVPKRYNPGIFHTIGLNKNVFKMNFNDLRIDNIIKKILYKIRYSKKSIQKFDEFRHNNLNLSVKVQEESIENILSDYYAVIVGSDQIWNPQERKKDQYFLNYKNISSIKKISYAADSTIEEINDDDFNKLSISLKNFDYISVRNNHSLNFVKALNDKEVSIVADPTLLHNFNDSQFTSSVDVDKEYIFSYVLGKEIDGSHKKVIEMIRERYGDIPIYFSVITTSNFKFYNCADRVFYDLGPLEWLYLLKHSKFVYTDSFHGTLFAMKYHKPFIAYYAEKNRSTRFVDMANRYQINDFIVENVDDINKKNSLNKVPNYEKIDNLIEQQKYESIDFLRKSLT